MFEWLTSETQPDDAIAILKRDHDLVKDLFEEYEKAEGRPKKRKLAAQIVNELKIHATIEEEIFYPSVRKHVGKDLMNEADEEHHVAKVLIAELESMTGREDHYDAKMTVLAENVRHHIKEEEGEMLPKAREVKMDMVKLGQEMLRRKKQLETQGVPRAAEAAMVAASHGKGDSPAKAAAKSKSRPAKHRTA